MATRPAHFTLAVDGTFEPTEFTRSRWGDDMLNGPAVVGLAAFSLENEYGVPGFLPTRLTVDLFRAARRVPTTTRLRLVRDGHRVRNAECDIVQADVVVARATLVQYRQSAPPPGREWMREDTFAPPEAAEGNVYHIGSDDAGWSPSGAAHQNTSRKRVYHRPVDVVADRPPTPFVRAVVVAEATSLVGNMGTRGIGYINGDLTVALARLPETEFIGVQGDSHWCSDGVSVSSGTLFDGSGPFGTGLVTAVANPAAQIDFGAGEEMTTAQV